MRQPTATQIVSRLKVAAAPYPRYFTVRNDGGSAFPYTPNAPIAFGHASRLRAQDAADAAKHSRAFAFVPQAVRNRLRRGARHGAHIQQSSTATSEGASLLRNGLGTRPRRCPPALASARELSQPPFLSAHSTSASGFLKLWGVRRATVSKMSFSMPEAKRVGRP